LNPEARWIAVLDALPENRTNRCRELLRASLALADDLLQQSKDLGRQREVMASGGFQHLRSAHRGDWVLHSDIQDSLDFDLHSEGSTEDIFLGQYWKG
jgi:hypothetical protein